MAEAIALIDYGAGNLRSVHNALKAAGAAQVAVTDDPNIVRGARRIVLPGVGSFRACMNGLQSIPGMIAAGKGLRKPTKSEPPAGAVATCHQPPKSAAARRFISSGGTSSLCVAIHQRWPNGSSNLPPRSP